MSKLKGISSFPYSNYNQLMTTVFIDNIVSEKKHKKLSLKVTLTVEIAMSLVGVLTFFLWKI